MMGAWEAIASWSVLWAEAMARASWQGGLALAIAWLVCRLFPRLSPSARSWLWRLAYLKLVLSLFWSAPVPLPVLPTEAVGSRQSVVGSRQNTEEWANGRMGERESRIMGRPTPNPRPSTPNAQQQPRPAPILPYLFITWVLVAGVMGVRLGRDWLDARRLREDSFLSEDPWLGACCQGLAHRMGVRHRPEVLVGGDGGSPLLTGPFRPAIIVPEIVLANSTTSETEMMMAHELGHLRRRDLQWSCLPALARVLFFFHPLEWVGSREWRLSQETACDEMALRATRVGMADYGQLLVKVGAQHFPLATPGAGLLTVGVVNSARTLRLRLIAMKSLGHLNPQSRLAACALGLVAIAALVPWRLAPRPAGLLFPEPSEVPVVQPIRSAGFGGDAADVSGRAEARTSGSTWEQGAERVEQRSESRGQGPGATSGLQPGPTVAPPLGQPGPALSPPVGPGQAQTGSTAPSQFQAQAPSLRPTAAPLDEVGSAIVDLRSPDDGRRHRAANYFAGARVEVASAGDRAEITRRLEDLLDEPDQFQRTAAIRALRIWGNSQSVPRLIARLDDAQHAVRWAAIEVLGAVRDPRAVDPLAQMVSSGRDRAFASRALQAMGPLAEPAGLRLIRDRDSWARLEGCRILQAVGGQASIPALEGMRSDPDGLVKMAAGSALEGVATRLRNGRP